MNGKISLELFELITVYVVAIAVVVILLVIVWPPRWKKKIPTRSRIIISWTGPVKVKAPEKPGDCTDACTEQVLIGDEKIVWGIWSIFERYAEENRIIHMTIEDVTDLIQEEEKGG